MKKRLVLICCLIFLVVPAFAQEGRMPLFGNIHKAARRGALLRVKRFLDAGVKVNEQDESGMTPLHLVGSARVAQELIKRGADVNARDNNGGVPLHYSRNAEITKLLLDNGAQVSAKDKQGNTALHVAATLGSIKGKSISKVLIDAGAKVDAVNLNGDTPLHVACAMGHVREASLLIEKGADTNAKNKQGITPLQVACSFMEIGEGDEGKLIGAGLIGAGVWTAGTWPSMYFAATALGKGWVVQKMLGQRVVRVSTINHIEVLWRAGGRYRMQSLGLISLSAGAIILIASIVGPPVIKAIKRRVLINRLLDAGAKVNETDSLGNAALHRVASGSGKSWTERLESYTVAKMLVGRNADPDIKNHARFTPYAIAMTFGRKKLANFLKSKMKTSPTGFDGIRPVGM